MGQRKTKEWFCFYSFVYWMVGWRLRSAEQRVILGGASF
jgi:hypothetical protein